MADKSILELIEKMSDLKVLIDEPMSSHTTFKTGGCADALIIPKSIEELCNTIAFLKEALVPIILIGNGSNLIVSDEGIRGAAIKFGSDISEIKFCGNRVCAQAGARLSTLSRDCIQKGFKGLHTVGGIPASVGGAIYMNAGAYGGCVADYLESVSYINESLEICQRKIIEGDMKYRNTFFSENGFTVLEGTWKLIRDTDGLARKEFDECNAQRKAKQPLEYPSAGSIFKRPEGHFAGKLIEDAGLKGERIGGAMVSELHAGFIINTGDATSGDILELIELIQKRVFEHFGIMLETEVKII